MKGRQGGVISEYSFLNWVVVALHAKTNKWLVKICLIRMCPSVMFHQEELLYIYFHHSIDEEPEIH